MTQTEPIPEWYLREDERRAAKILVERVYIAEQKNSDGGITFRLRWRPGGHPTKWTSVRLFTTEPSPSKTRLGRWRAEAADARRAKEKELNEGQLDLVRHLRTRLDYAMKHWAEWVKANRSESLCKRAEMLTFCLKDYYDTVGGPEYVHHVDVSYAAWFRNWLMLDKAPATVNAYLADLAGAWKRFIGEGWAVTNPWKTVNRADNENVTVLGPDGRPVLAGKTLAFSTAAEMWAILERLPEPRRSQCGFLATTGLRIQEAANVQIDDWDPWAHMLFVKPYHTTRKASTKRHQRSIPTPPCCEMFLKALSDMNRVPGPWLLSGGRKITTQVNKALAHLGVSPHDFRRFFRTRLEGLMLPTYVIDDLLGHTTTPTRAAYVPDQNIEAAREAMAQFNEVIMEARPATLYAGEVEAKEGAE